MSDHGREPLRRYGPERERHRRRLAILLVVSLALPLGGAGLWILLARLLG